MAIFLLFVLLFNIGGLYLVFRFQQHQIRKEVKHKIKLGVPQNELYLIRISPDNQHLIQWIHSKEFRYKGVMYDVVRKKTIDAKTIEFACINDEQEAKLFAHLDEEINKSNNNHSNATPI